MHLNMKPQLFTKLILLMYCITACTYKTPAENGNSNTANDTVISSGTTSIDSFTAGKVIEHVVCKTDAAQSYALYIPAKGNNEVLPVIYFFDPHGNGALPLNKYKALADEYDFIFIGSNNSKNGNDFSTAENIFHALSGDVQTRLKINTSRIYTCGFSGGAKVAGYLALHHSEVKGVIANGAGLPDATSAGNFNFSFTAVTGEGDMNMTDLVAITNELDNTQTTHRIIFFDGKHEWAPENAMSIAFAGLQFDAMRTQLIQKDNAFISNYILESKNRVAEYTANNRLIKAEQECKLSISMLDGLTTEVNWFKTKDAAFAGNAAFQQQWQAQQNLLATEQQMKAAYTQQFQQGDINYWNKTITDLQIKAGAQTDEGAMYQRLLAYLSLAFYSISNQFINSNQNNEAQYFVGLYKMADATNSEAWYFSAILNARNNNAKAAESDLIKAVGFGFTDKDRMLQQPEFIKLASEINFAEIKSKMKKGE